MSNPHSIELERLADEIGGDHGDILRGMAGAIRAKATGEPATRRSLNRSSTLLEVVSAASQSKDDATLGRLATLRLRCSRLGLDLDATADTPLKVAVVDAAFAKGSGTVSDKISAKSALFREGL